MRILVLNGVNLNILGKRQPEIYGKETFEDFLVGLRASFPSVVLDYQQSNHEGELVECLQQAELNYQAVVFNAGAYTHTSVALRDAIATMAVPVVEVHISNIYAREAFRHRSMIAPVCLGQITGFGLVSYQMAVYYFLNHFSR